MKFTKLIGLGLRKSKKQQDRKSFFRSAMLEGLEDRKLMAFGVGNLAVYRVGDGSAALTSAATSVFIDEYTPSGTLVQSIALPTAVAGANFALTASGTATSEGLITRSVDGQYLVLGGYSASVGTVGVASASATTVPRVAGRIDASGTINTTTALTDYSSGGSPRGIASIDGNQFFVTGANGGIRFASLSSTTSTQLSTSVVNLRSVSISNGQLYVSSQSGTTRLATVGTGVPTTSGQTITNLPGFPTSGGNPWQFFFADLDAGVAGDDTVYVADESSATGGILKYSLVGGSWVARGSIGPAANAIRGLTGVVSGGTVTLYASGSSGSFSTPTSTILTFADTTGYNNAVSGTATAIVTLPSTSNRAFRGIAMTPVASSNNSPTITDIPNSSTDEDVPTSAINFTVGDVETSAGSLTVTATSSNTILVPNANITLGGSGANRTIQLTPAADRNGTTVISVTVSDGTATATDTFTLTVNAVNDAPTIENVLDQSTGLNLPRVINFAINDVDLDNNLLTMSGSSSNQTLVPDANIVFTGTGSNRTVTITPASNQSGNATITLVVSDGTLTGSDTFVLTVAANTPPTITDIVDQTINEDSATSDLAFTIGDAEQAVGTLVVTATSSNTALIPNANLTLGGSGANRTIKATPVANGNGSSVITVTVSDGITTSTDTFTVNVTPVNDDPTISTVADQSIEKNGSTGALAFTINDVDGDLLTLSGTSSNTTLVPNANIVFGGTGNSRTVTVTPAAEELGTTTITLTVNDGTTTASSTFVLTVNNIFAMYISEINFNTPGVDAPNEYVEIRGEPNSVVPAGTYLVGIEGDSNGGDVQTIFNLSGKIFGPNGLMTLLQASNSYGLSGAGVYTGTTTGFGGLAGFSADTGTDIENDSASYLLIRASTAPTLTDDIDSNNDALGDGSVFAGWTILDNVAVLDGFASDVAYGNLVFSNGAAGIIASGATTISTSAAATYVGRVGSSTTQTAADWLAGVTTGATPGLFALVRASTSNVSFAGARLDNVGGQNIFTPAGVTVTQSGGTTDVTEGGVSDSYTFVLNTQPVGNVNVTVTPTAQINLGAGAGVAITLSFTSANWNTPQTVNVSANDDTDVEGPHTALITHVIASGSTADYLGLTVASLSVNITDNDSANQPPNAENQSVFTNEDNALNVTLTATDANNDPLTYTIVTGPANGTLTGTAPNITYIPNPNFFGQNTIVFKANDGQDDSNDATITITVNAVNDVPVADAQSVSTDEDTPLGITLTGSDVENDPLTYMVVTGPANGTLSGTAPNLTYTPNANFFGSDSVVFKVNDGTVDSAVATINIAVAPINDAPTANSQTVNLVQDTPTSITLTGADVDGDSLTYTVVGSPSNGSLSGTAPNLTYTPNTGYSGPDSFTFKVNDGTVDSSVVTVTLNIGSNGIVNGTTGVDVLTVTQLGGSFNLSLVANGGSPTDLGNFANGSPITFNGLAGVTDRIVFVGGAGADSVTISAAGVNFNGSNFTLTGVEDLTVDMGAGNDQFTVEGRPIPAYTPKVGATPARNLLTLIGGADNDTYNLDADNTLGVILMNEAGGGVDTISLANTTGSGVNVNLGSILLQTVNPNLSLLLASNASFENVIGGLGNDTLTGNTLANRLEGRGGDDTLVGLTGNDRYVFDSMPNSGTDTITDSSGIDTIDFFSSAMGISLNLLTTTVQAVNANQSLILGTSIIEGVVGSQANDSIIGNNSANFLEGSGGDDYLEGGLGNDTYLFNADTNIGTDTINDSVGSDTLDFSPTLSNGVNVSLLVSTVQVVNSNLSLVLSTANLLDNLVGSQANDTLIGHNLTNRLTGMGGDDLLQGMGGNDTYWFRSDVPMGTDTINDSAGTADVLDFSTSVVGVSVDMNLTTAQTVTPNLQLVFATNNAIENVTGSAFDDSLIGNSLNNRLIGGAGSDSLNGGDGNDTFVFDTDVLQLGTDTIDDTSGIDTLDFSTTTMRQIAVNIGITTSQVVNTNLSLIVASATAFENLIGGSMGDTLIGNANDNRFTGRAGDDLLVGGAGNDSYSFDADLALGTDTLDEAGGGLDTIDFTGTTMTGVAIDLSVPGSQAVSPSLNLILSANNTFERVIGSSLGDTIQGNSANNILMGMNGNDNLHGGDGRDLLIGGTGADTMTGGNDDDLLVAGTTSYDAIQASLYQVFAEWTGPNDYVTRVNNLKTGTGVPSFAKTTIVKKDLGSNTLTGGLGEDFFYANVSGGTDLTDAAMGEVLEDL